jgi:hypothetical protein
MPKIAEKVGYQDKLPDLGNLANAREGRLAELTHYSICGGWRI